MVNISKSSIMEVEYDLDFQNVVRNRVTPAQYANMVQREQKLINMLKKEGLSDKDINQLLSPVDKDTIIGVYFLSQIDRIDFAHLVALTEETGVQLDYIILLPLIMKKETGRVKQQNILDLRRSAEILRDKMSINPNKLADLLDKVADSLEIRLKEQQEDGVNRTRDIIILSVILLTIIIVFLVRNKENLATILGRI